MKYEDIVSKEQKLQIKFGEEALNIVYDNTKLNKSTSIAVADEKELYIDFLAEFLSTVLVSWDLSINDKPVKISKESLITLNMAFLDRIYKEIQESSAGFFNK